MKPVNRVWCGFLFVFLTLLGLGLTCFWAFRLELSYFRSRESIDRAAARYHVPPRLVAAVIWQETRFNPAASGKAGEIGLMQVMPATAGEWSKAERLRDFSLEILWNPETNVLAGTWYLGRAIRRWSAQEDPLPYALAEYNAGRSNALRWERISSMYPGEFTRIISYPSTRLYVKTVLRNYRFFGQPWKRWSNE